MASGKQPILNCPSTISALNGLVVVGDTGAATPSTPSAIGALEGTTGTGTISAQPALLVKFV